MAYYKGMPSHESVLIFFQENPGKEFSTHEVSNAICLSAASVSTNARFLVNKGLLTRRPVTEKCGMKYLYKLKEGNG
jgi:predicted transcriptional regulator